MRNADHPSFATAESASSENITGLSYRLAGPSVRIPGSSHNTTPGSSLAATGSRPGSYGAADSGAHPMTGPGGTLTAALPRSEDTHRHPMFSGPGGRGRAGARSSAAAGVNSGQDPLALRRSLGGPRAPSLPQPRSGTATATLNAQEVDWNPARPNAQPTAPGTVPASRVARPVNGHSSTSAGGLRSAHPDSLPVGTRALRGFRSHKGVQFFVNKQAVVSKKLRGALLARRRAKHTRPENPGFRPDP